MFVTWKPAKRTMARQKALPSLVAWECCQIDGGWDKMPIVKSGYCDPADFYSGVYSKFKDGAIVAKQDGLLIVAVDADYDFPMQREEFDARVLFASGGCTADWNVAEALVREWCLRHM